MASKAKTKKAPKAKAPAKKAEAKTNGNGGGRHAEAFASAELGKLPEAPKFPAKAAYKPFVAKLGELQGFVKAGDIAGLKSYPLNPSSTSRKKLDRYRNLAIISLQAKAKGAGKTA